MKNRISTLLAIFILFTSFSLFGQTRDVGEFHAVRTSTSVDVTLIKANKAKIEFTMKKGDAEDLITKVKNGVLYIKTKSNSGFWGNNTEAKVEVYYTDIDEIKASAGSSVKSEDVIVADNMEIAVNSGASAKLQVKATKIEVDVSSGASLKLKGSAKKGKFYANSGAKLDAYYFETDYADADVSSGASISIHVNDTLNAEAGSGGSIKYTGDVKTKNIDEGWSGSIKRKN